MRANMPHVHHVCHVCQDLMYKVMYNFRVPSSATPSMRTLPLHKIDGSGRCWDLTEDVQQARFDPGTGAEREGQNALGPTETPGTVQ